MYRKKINLERKISAVIFVIAVVFLAGICIAPIAAESVDQQAYAPDRVIVQFQDMSHANAGPYLCDVSPLLTPEEILADFSDFIPGLQVIQLPDGVTVEQAIAYYSGIPGVIYAEPDYYYSIYAVPNDTYYSALWGLKNTGAMGGAGAEAAWDITTGNDSVIVAVIDSGVDYLHPDLAPHIWVNPNEIAGDGMDNDGNGFVDDIHGWNFFTGDSDPMDYNGHGTHCAGTIGAVANNNYGVAGTAWNVTIMPVAVMNPLGSGAISDICSGILYAVNNSASILSMSLGGYGTPSETYQQAIDYAEDHGVLIVAAAGNENNNNDVNPSYPASFTNDNIISVAASAQSNNRAWFSNYGASAVDIAAPGVSIKSTYPNVIKDRTLDKFNDVTKFECFGNWSFDHFGEGNGAYVEGIGESILLYNFSIDPQGSTFVFTWEANYTLNSGYLFLILSAADGSLMNFGMNQRYNSGNRFVNESSVFSWNEIKTALGGSGPYYASIYYISYSATNHVWLKSITIENNYRLDSGSSGHDFAVLQGTSMATPMVAGAAALIKSINKTMTPSEIRELFINTADRVGDWNGKVVSNGRLNITAAVLAARPQCTVTFDTGKGSVIPQQELYYGDYVERPTPDPTCNGYEFMGWYSNPEYTNEWNFEDDKLIEPTTIYAKWNVITKTIQAIDDGGISVAPVNQPLSSPQESPYQVELLRLENVSNSIIFVADSGDAGMPDEEDLTVYATFEITRNESDTGMSRIMLSVKLTNPAERYQFYLKHYTDGVGWDDAIIAPNDISPLDLGNNVYQYTFETDRFSPFALVKSDAEMSIEFELVGDDGFVVDDGMYYLALGTSANISVYLNVTAVDPTPVNFTTYNMTYAANFTMDEMTAVYADAKNFMKVYEIKSTAAKTNDTVKLGIQSGRLDYYTMNDGDKLFIGNITVTAPSSWSDVDNLDVYTITLKDALKVNREGVIPQPESAEENDDFIDIAGTSFNFYPVKGELAYAAYHDGRYEYKQKLQASEEMKPTFYLYQDVFRDSYADGAYFQLYLDDPDAQGKGYNWSNGGLSQLTFKHVQTIGGDNLTNHVTLNGLVSSAHQIKFAILQGSDPYTEVLGSSRNASVVIEDYMQSNENNSMTKSASEDGWFFNTPYTVTMEVRPGPIAYNWTNETQGHAAGVMWDSSYQIPNLTNNAGKEAVVEWRVEFANNENTTFNNYTAETGKLRGQEVMNSADNLMVKESQSAVGENVTITLTGWKLGDANKNGEVSFNDASSISFYAIAGASASGAYDAALAGVPGSTYEHLIISDCNKQGGDGMIDVADILMFNKWLTEGDAIIGEWIGA